MYKKGGEFSSLFDHLSNDDKDWYAHNAYGKNAKTDWSFSDENLADMKNEAKSLIDKVAKGELDNEEAASDLYAIYALLTDANFHDDAREIAKLAHDFYADDALGDWDDEYVSDEQLAAHEEQMKKDLETPDDPDESSEKPHDEELAGEKTPEEDFMERAAAGEVPATSGVLAGDLTPEEIEMIQMMRAGKQPPKSKDLAGETTPEEKEMLKLAGNQTLSDERFKNITNRLAKNLSKHRW